MNFLMPHVAARLFGEPLMVDPGKLAAILMGIGGRIVEGGVVLPSVLPVDHTAFAGGRPSEGMGTTSNLLERAIAAGPGSRILDRVGNVAVIPIEGTLVQKGKFIGQSSGETSYEGIRAQVGIARRDDTIKGVVLEVDSRGGEVPGAFEAAAAIAELAKAKPTIAILTDFAFSAGYLLASQARQIVMPEGGGAGSIGIIAMHVDLSRKLEADGMTVTLITSGKHKADGHPASPLAEDVRSVIQLQVDATRERFVAAVGRGRGKRLDAAAALATEAQSYVGEAAVKAGLVDGIADSQAAFQEFVRRVN